MNQAFARRRILFCCIILMFGFVCGGATCSQRQTTYSYPPPPPILNPAPSLQQVATAVNRTSAIRELSTNTASVDVLSMPAIPTLSSTTISLRRDREFRLRASLPVVMGSGLDMGSNQNQFWFEVPEGIGRTLYFANHDQYQRQLDRAMFPVDPTWVMDALGLVQIDPVRVVAGPVVRPDGKLEVRSTIPFAAGMFQRVCYVDATAGHVTDQFLYAPSGALIAQSSASNHEFFPEQQCSLPHTVQINLLPTSGQPLQLKIDVGSYAVNQILSGDPNLFAMPQGANNVVDLSTLGGSTVPIVAPASYQTSAIGPLPYRGLVR